MKLKERKPSLGDAQGRLKIFVSAYACEPNLGSEIGVGWHWVLEMSKYFDLWVLTRESNRHTIEPWIAKHPAYKDIHWLYYDWPKWARWWKKGLRGVRTYYNLWQICSDRIVKRTMQENDIKVFHHLTYGNALWKVSRYGQKQFFIWGPVGGLETIPKDYSRYYSWKSRIIEMVRRRMAALSAWNPDFRERCRNADLILCKTAFTQQYVPQAYAKKTRLFTDVAADCIPSHTQPKERDYTAFISVGRLDAWRGFDLIIEAMEAAVQENDRIHLTILGEGPDRERLEHLIKKKALDKHISMPGKVTMAAYKRQLGDADVVINAALKEGAVTVSFDAMAMGKPLICLDTTGYTRYFTDDYAILIARAGRKEVIGNIKDGMIRLTRLEERRVLGRNALDAARRFSWEKHGRDIMNAIEEAFYNR